MPFWNHGLLPTPTLRVKPAPPTAALPPRTCEFLAMWQRQPWRTSAIMPQPGIQIGTCVRIVYAFQGGSSNFDEYTDMEMNEMIWINDLKSIVQFGEGKVWQRCRLGELGRALFPDRWGASCHTSPEATTASTCHRLANSPSVPGVADVPRGNTTKYTLWLGLLGRSHLSNLDSVKVWPWHSNKIYCLTLFDMICW